MIKHRTFIFLLTFLLTSVFIVSSAVAQRGIVPVSIKDTAGNQVGLYKGSYALIIGVSDYTEGWQDLESVPSEVNDLVSALEEQGFHVVKMLNPNSRQLKEVFEDFIAQYGFDPDNRLLFFFSGHGYTRQVGKITKGYLVPTDAPIPEHDPKGFKNKALSMKQIITWAEGEVESKHALFLFDSCFSGTILTSRGRPPIPRPIRDSTNRPVRQFMSAGTAGQLVPSQSVFVPYFIRALKGDGDLNRDGYVTGTELGLYLRDQIMGGDTHQTPQVGKSFNPNFNEGDFVFALLNPATPEKSIEALERERKDLEQRRQGFADKRKRFELKKQLAEAKRKLEEEKKRLAEEEKKMEIASLPPLSMKQEKELDISQSQPSIKVIQVDSDFDGKLDQWQHKSEDDRLLKVEYDKNGDGKIDQIDIFDGSEKPVRVELDRDFDGTLDQVQHYSKGFILKYIEKDSKFSGLIDWREVYGPDNKVARLETDENQDGKKDVFQYFSAEGHMERVEYDTSYDGKIDRWEFFGDDGALMSTNFDTNRDGNPDQWQYFKNSTLLIRVEHDTNFDGKVNRWEYFDGHGKMERLELDKDHDGNIDLVKKRKK
jgi:hypothetical protein